MTTEGFYLGGEIDAKSGDRTETLVDYDPGDLTTHGVIVGMTGSGKTGLGIIYLEEALLSGIPTLVIDPKGDMTNLLLTFPDLLPEDFEPWVDDGEARKENKTRPELALEKAELWKKGLGWWDQDGSRIAALKDAAGFTVYTPGSSAGEGVNIVGSLAVPELSWEDDAETLRDEIQGFVSGLLGLAGEDVDPISSRQHILLSNLIEHSWRQGIGLDMATLLGQIQRPPIRKLGVFEVDSFFPEKDRMALAMKLNGLMASPSFASWMEGRPLDIGNMLWDADGKPQAAIVYLAHLSDEERQFIVTLLLSKVVTWMRTQQGTGDLRAMVYMDEVFGFVPPTASPPAKKPILTMLKQARAFGVGMLLSTQNPVDLDYKAMSNAGTWCIGRLQTERDKARILEALESASGGTDIKQLDDTISGLDSRQFLLHNTHADEPALFTTRWALSYLAGPLTRDQVGRLMDGRSAPAPTPTTPAPQPEASTPATTPEAPTPTVPSPPPLSDSASPIMPNIAEGVAVFHVDPAAPWLESIGGDARSTHYRPGLAARVQLVFDETSAKLNHREEWEAVFTPLAELFDADVAAAVDYDDRDLIDVAATGATYELTDAPLQTKTYFRRATTAIKDHLHRERQVTVYRNTKLKLYSRVGEDETSFLERTDQAAQDRADAETAKLKDKYDAKFRKAQDAIEVAERRADEIRVDLEGARQTDMLDKAGALINILTGRGSTRSVTGSSRSRAARRSKEQRLATAEGKIGDLSDVLLELDHDLREELEEINDRWEDIGDDIETIEVGLEKSDILVEDVALVWIPS
ncbi:MAG: ATP-binding protein [bacterium]|nr:ATP-binding protein [bacterium]